VVEDVIHIDFSPSDRVLSTSRLSCTRAEVQLRNLILQPRAEHEVIREARRWQRTEESDSLYARGAGIESTFSQGVISFGLRRARYEL
jgi:transposase